jgi:hypothetical protein
MPVYTHEDKKELKDQKARKKPNKKENANPKKSLLQKEADFINDLYDI